MLKPRTLMIAVLLVLITILPSQAQTPPPPSRMTTPQLIDAALARGEIDQTTANLYLVYALTDHERLPARFHSTAPWHGTLPLLRLREATERMRPSTERAIIEKMLSGTCSSSTGTLSNITNSTNFHVQYGTISGGLSIGDYTTSLETTWSTEVTNFGWAAPPVLTGNPPPGNRYHVRIDNLGSGLYGYVSSSGAHAGYVGNNPNTAWDDGDAYASCMVLNNDYSSFGDAQKALDATTAHEFNHSIQFGYGALTGTNAPDDSFIEGGATWMEDEVFDGANDNYNYLWPTFNICMGQYTDNPYPYWITFRGLTERYGTGSASAGEQVMQDFWESTSQSASSNMLTALNSALVSKGTTLPQAYHDYAIAVKFNRTCGGGYVLPYCFEEASGYVSAAGSTSVHGSISTVGGSNTGSIQDYYALRWIGLPSSGDSYAVTLENTSAGGQLRGSVVCDTGSALNVHALPAVVGAGQSTTLYGFDPAPCSSVVAVLTNEGGALANPSSCTARSYQLSTSELNPVNWEKDVYVNGQLAGSNTIYVQPYDTVRIVDRVNLVMTGTLNYTLVETWTQALELVPPAQATTGSVVSSTGWLEWDASGVLSSTWHVLTKTFNVISSTWTTGSVTETLWVDGADPQPDDIVINVLRGQELYLPLVMRSYPQILMNGDFESGRTAWTEYSTHGFVLIMRRADLPEDPHGGRWAAWLGGYESEISFIEQDVTIQASTPYLAYYHWINSADACGFDFGGVLIDGSTVVDVYNLCGPTNTGGWVKHVVNLSAYIGQTVAVQIRAENDSLYVSNLLVDDVAFQATPSREAGDYTLVDPEPVFPWLRQTIHSQSGLPEDYLLGD
jgi:hypothetical protein